jgi:hypothetical protein
MYKDNKGRILFLSQGIGQTEWGTFYRKPFGSLARVKSPSLPMRPIKEQAAQDLHEQAKRRGWELEIPF